MIWRQRTDFWGSGPRWRDSERFSFHHLQANAPEEEVEPHGHAEAHFVLVLAGGYMSSAQGAPDVSATPILIYNPPGTEHQDRFHQGRGRFLAISGGTEGADLPATCLRDPYAIAQAREIAAGFEHATPFGLAARAWQLQAAVLPLSSDEARGASDPPGWLRRAVEMIFTSDEPGLSVARVAQEVGVHPVHLARVFRQQLGCAPGDYLRGRRLERAAALLGRGLASLAEVAHDSGFVDQAHLSRSFRGYLHSTPGEWRRLRHVAPIQDAPASGR